MLTDLDEDNRKKIEDVSSESVIFDDTKRIKTSKTSNCHARERDF